MSSINTNISALIAQNSLAKSNNSLQTTLERLSTGLKINTGADDPAGLIVSQRLASEIAGVNQSIDNVTQATNVISTADGALSQIGSLLTSIQGLTVQAANTGAFSPAEIQANQLQIDSAVDSITRIANSTSFGGMKLLNGTLDYTTSGVNASQIQDVQVNAANFGTASNIPVTVEVLNSAQAATLFISGNITGAAGKLASAVTFDVTGSLGVQSLQFASGTSLSAVAFAIDQVKDATGVSASLASATDQTSGLKLSSTTLGSSGFVSVKKLEGGATFNTYNHQAGSAISRATGQDVLALINGNLALGDGTQLTLNTGTLNMSLNLTQTAAQTLGTYTFDITGGGANFQIGAGINTSQQVGIGIQSVESSNLGNATDGYLSSIVTGGTNSLVAGQASEASNIINDAINQISDLRGRLGAFESNTLQTAASSQTIALQNLTSSNSDVVDADFASETSNLSRAQILVQAGTSTLALANSNAQNVLKLLQ